MDTWGRAHAYPFLVHLVFTDPSLYLAFTVGHDYSFVEFAYGVDASQNTWHGPFYLKNHAGDHSQMIPIYYGASYTELDTTRMLPYSQALATVYCFIQHQKFPAEIEFDDAEVRQRFTFS